MVVAIAGAHGQIALRTTRLLVADGEEVIGLIRNPDHAGEVGEHGASAVVCDLENANVEEIAEAIRGADAVVFAAGAGPGSGADRKLTMDRDGAIKLLEAARIADVDRYLIISSVGAENPPQDDEVFSVYLRAKAQADEAVRQSDRQWIILRPGRLTDDAGSGKVQLDCEPFRGAVPRDDVAAVLVRLLREPRALRHILYLNGGETPIEQAVELAL